MSVCWRHYIKLFPKSALFGPFFLTLLMSSFGEKKSKQIRFKFCCSRWLMFWSEVIRRSDCSTNTIYKIEKSKISERNSYKKWCRSLAPCVCMDGGGEKERGCLSRGTLAAWLVSNKYADINNYVNVDGAKSKRADSKVYVKRKRQWLCVPVCGDLSLFKVIIKC